MSNSNKTLSSLIFTTILTSQILAAGYHLECTGRRGTEINFTKTSEAATVPNSTYTLDTTSRNLEDFHMATGPETGSLDGSNNTLEVMTTPADVTIVNAIKYADSNSNNPNPSYVTIILPSFKRHLKRYGDNFRFTARMHEQYTFMDDGRERPKTKRKKLHCKYTKI